MKVRNNPTTEIHHQTSNNSSSQENETATDKIASKALQNICTNRHKRRPRHFEIRYSYNKKGGKLVPKQSMVLVRFVSSESVRLSKKSVTTEQAKPESTQVASNEDSN